jgi:hypothetical protein
MSAYKYTTDGKKVLVVGKLNAQQSIVQEVFISAGQEIPSGENFVVGSLHDAPVESWKEKNLRETEENYDRRKKQLEKEYESVSNRLIQAQEKAKLRAASLFAFAKNSDDSQLQTLKDFVSGEITHFYVDSYKPAIITWEGDEVYQVDNWGGRQKIEELRLISLFGKSDGHMHFKLGQYCDGSGGYKYEIFPCKSYEEALAKAQERFDFDAAAYLNGDKYFDPSKWERIQDIKVSEPVKAKFAAQKKEAKDKRLAELQKQISELEG